MTAATRFGAATLAELLRAPATGGVTFVAGAGAERRLDHDELRARALSRLAAWRRAGARAGARVVLLIEDRERFLECLHAALLGALVPVPLAGGTSDEHRAKLFAVARTLGEPHLAVEPAALDRLEAFAAARGLRDALGALMRRALPVGPLAPDEPSHDAGVGTAHDEGVSGTGPAPDDVALIQFSSGSTGAPKGVVLTHANLLANVDAILDGMAMRGDDVMLSWMPLTHDMGLIGFHLVPRLAGIEHVLMPTALFVRRPGLWLETATAHRATVLCSPNFGYEHALKGYRADRGDALELSAVRLVFNGAEPISAALAHRFSAVHAAHGLDARAMFPVYGLAEASLAVTFPPVGAPVRVRRVARDALGIGDAMRAVPESVPGALELVGLGRPIRHVEVRIADADGVALDDGRIGRILIRGPNVTGGYVVDGGGRDSSAIDAEGWLDTGDLGGFEAAGEGAADGGAGDPGRGDEGPWLFVTGRAKDIVFVGGRNLHPADLERVVVAAGAADAGKVVVAAVPTADAGSDLVAAFVQHRSGADAFAGVAEAVRAALAAEAGVRCDLVVAVPRVPKTTSGKVQRFRLVEALLAGELAPEALRAALDAAATSSSVDASVDASMRVAPGAAPAGADRAAAGVRPTDAPGIEAVLLGICRTRVEGGAVVAEDNLFELGISSLTLASIHADIEAIWPGELDITDLFDHPSVAEIAGVLAGRHDAG